MTNIGKISYPLYLWHWPIFIFLLINNIHPTGIIATPLTFILSYLTYQYVEKPIRFGKYKKQSTMILSSLMVATGLTALAIWKL